MFSDLLFSVKGKATSTAVAKDAKTGVRASNRATMGTFFARVAFSTLRVGRLFAKERA